MSDWRNVTWVHRLRHHFYCRMSLGQNGQIPSIFEIFSNRTLFQKLLEIYHFFWYSSLVSSSNQARVPYFLIHYGTMTWKAGIKIFRLILEHVKLGYWLNSTRVCRTRVPSVHLLHNHLLT